MLQNDEQDETSHDETSDKASLVPNEIIKTRRCPITIEPIVMGLFLTESLAEAVTTNLLVTRACEVHFNFNKTVCRGLGNQKINDTDIEALVQPYVAVIISSMTFLSVFHPAIMSLFVGPWSDYNGRKLVLIVPALGYFAKYILLGIFSAFPNLNPLMALIGVLPIALSGGMVNFIFAAYTYISDITTEDNRSTRIGILESFMTAGSVIGLLSSGPVFTAAGEYGFVVVYAYGACVLLLVTIPTYLFVPESIQRSESGKGISQVFQPKLFKEMLEISFRKRANSRRAVIFLTIISLTITVCTMIGEGNVMYLFIRLRFGWNVQKYTIWSSITLAIGFTGVLFGILLFVKILKISDPVICAIVYGLKCSTALYLAFLPRTEPMLMYFVGAINIFGGLAGPIARSVLSKSVPKEDLGKVFALLSSSEAIFPLGVGPLYTVVYNSTINILPSAFLFLSAFLFFICCTFFIIIYFIHKPLDQTQYNQLENEIG